MPAAAARRQPVAAALPPAAPVPLPNPLNSPVPSEMFLDISLLCGNDLCFGAGPSQLLKSWLGNILG